MGFFDINATTFAMAILLNAITTVILALRFSKGVSENRAFIGVLAFLLSVTLPPLGWLFCWFYSEKKSILAALQNSKS